MQPNPKLFYQAVLLMIFPILLNASDILYENNWTRIVTGDNSTRLTRGISEQPQPKEINIEALKKILIKMDYTISGSSQLEAWLFGLKQHGWAQLENEPEYDLYHALQIIVIGENKLELLVKNFESMGQTAEALFSLEGKQLSFKNIEIPEILNRDVFYTVQSPALFVLNQEHFQKQFLSNVPGEASAI